MRRVIIHIVIIASAVMAGVSTATLIKDLRLDYEWRLCTDDLATYGEIGDSCIREDSEVIYKKGE